MFIYLKVTERLDFKYSHHKKEMVIMWWMKVLAKPKAVIILQYTCVSNQHVVHPKLTQHMSIISQ